MVGWRGPRTGDESFRVTLKICLTGNRPGKNLILSLISREINKHGPSNTGSDYIAFQSNIK